MQAVLRRRALRSSSKIAREPIISAGAILALYYACPSRIDKVRTSIIS